MISKLLAPLLLVSLLLTGCVTKEYVYVKDACPAIQVLNPVPKISGKVSEEGCICNKELDLLINGARQLRQSEMYYHEQVSKYNNEFAVPKEKLDSK